MFFPTFITQNPPNIYHWLMECLKGNKVMSVSHEQIRDRSSFMGVGGGKGFADPTIKKSQKILPNLKYQLQT
jgi:hypothetical protein